VTTDPGVQPVASSALANGPELANVAADSTAASSPASTGMPPARRRLVAADGAVSGALTGLPYGPGPPDVPGPQRA